MRIVIDGRIYGPGWTGIGRYSQELIHNLASLDSKNEYIVLLRRDVYAGWKSPAANFRAVLADYKPYGLGEQLLLPLKLYRLQPDLVHFLHFIAPLLYLSRRVVTIHDLTLVHYKNIRGNGAVLRLRYDIKYWAMRLIIRCAVRGSAIITPTQTVADEIAEHYGLSPARIYATHEAVDMLATQPARPEATLDGQKYLLYVGNAYEYKNLDRLIEAFEQFKDTQPELKLVLAGKLDYFFSELKSRTERLGVTNVIFTGFVDDAGLIWLYQNAQAFVFPSLSEGFGLPPLEAMSYGTPVISSDASCMPEVLGDAAVYFDPKNVNDMVKVISETLASPETLARLRAAGPEHVKEFSWRRMAEQTLEVYRRVLNK